MSSTSYETNYQRNRFQKPTIVTIIIIGCIILYAKISSISEGIDENLSHRHLKFYDVNSTQEILKTNDENNIKPLIPHNLIFTYKHNILVHRGPPLYLKNVRNTIDTYRKAWNDPGANVLFFDDRDCTKLILQVEPRLVKHFNNEAHGPFRADICRIAALYFHGGYYFDVDIEVVQPLLLPPTTSFSSPIRKERPEWFFQAFVASAQGHPILRNAMESLLMVYKNELTLNALLGPETLRYAFDATAEEQKGEVLILEEFSLLTDFGKMYYPDFPQHCHGIFGCNFVVHDPGAMVIYFYSHVMPDELNG